jgi:hypothetical protein
MNENTIRRHLENLGWDAADIDDAIADWAEQEIDDARDREAEARQWPQS